MPDYPSYIFSISFVFLNSLLFCVISTVQWSGATSICDGIIYGTLSLLRWVLRLAFAMQIEAVFPLEHRSAVAIRADLLELWSNERLLSGIVKVTFVGNSHGKDWGRTAVTVSGRG